MGIRRLDCIKNRTYGFPASDTCGVLLDYLGKHGVYAIKVDATSSISCGSFTDTFDVPEKFKGQSLTAIRLQSPTSGYDTHNWFYTDPANGLDDGMQAVSRFTLHRTRHTGE